MFWACLAMTCYYYNSIAPIVYGSDLQTQLEATSQGPDYMYKMCKEGLMVGGSVGAAEWSNKLSLFALKQGGKQYF